MRPRSIQIFEYCYLGSMVLGLIGTAVNWSEMMAIPAIAAMVEQMPWYFPVTLVVGIAINLLLWYFVARRASVVAKWILVVLFGIGVAGLLISFARGAFFGSTAIFQIVCLALNVVAVWHLFTPDALAWFDKGKRMATPADLTDTFS